MATGQVFSALKADTVKTLQLDAGIIVHDIEDTAFEGLTSANVASKVGSKCIGATKGGASFSAVPEIRSLFDGVDGARGVYKQGEIIDSWEITLKATISEMTAANLKRILHKEPASSPEGYKSIGADVGMIAEANYKNMAWIGLIAGCDKPMIIFLKNALNINGVNFTAEDKATGAIEVEFKAHFDLADADTVPFTIYTPSAS